MHEADVNILRVVMMQFIIPKIEETSSKGNVKIAITMKPLSLWDFWLMVRIKL